MKKSKKIKPFQNLTHKQLLSLPVRDWGEISIYDSLLLVPARKMHDSGWMLIAIVGIREGEAVEIAAYPDAITWEGKLDMLKTDCTYPTGVIHFWTRGCVFEVGDACSSVDITLIGKIA